MKQLYNFFFISILVLLSCNSFAQKTKKEQREIQEIKSIFNEFPIGNHDLFPKQQNGDFILPSSFINYKNYFKKFDKNSTEVLNFVPSKIHKLTKADCDYLNKEILNDSNLIKIEKSWFTNKKIGFFSDSVIKSKSYFTWDFMKPIFFRNYTRCFIAHYDIGGMESFFLMKKNKHWVYDSAYLIVVND